MFSGFSPMDAAGMSRSSASLTGVRAAGAFVTAAGGSLAAAVWTGPSATALISADGAATGRAASAPSAAGIAAGAIDGAESTEGVRPSAVGASEIEGAERPVWIEGTARMPVPASAARPAAVCASAWCAWWPGAARTIAKATAPPTRRFHIGSLIY